MAPRVASAAGLHYTLDERPGFTRAKAGQGFVYRDAQARVIRDAKVLARIRSLAIPPAWTDVWICPTPSGHLQATGRDSRGRKQYRYHPRWREVRDETKYQRLLEFARLLPRVRARVQSDLGQAGLPRRKVIATVVRLLETTLIRVGNEEYARANRSYGLTTMRDSHVDVSRGRVRFRFRGKSGRDHVIDLRDAHLGRIVKRCQELPGQQLFQYLAEDGRLRAVESADVNAYVREVAGADFTAKDFRTWAGTVLAAWALHELAAESKPSKRALVRAIERVAARLGNTTSVCRKCYVHPEVVEAYLGGSLPATLEGRLTAEAKRSGLPANEARVLQLLVARSAARRLPAAA
jgi:DNA topoisomerase-1